MDNQSITHTRWNCTYHIVFIPKFRRKIMYGETLDCKISPENVDKISKIIVAPPDSGIDEIGNTNRWKSMY